MKQKTAARTLPWFLCLLFLASHAGDPDLDALMWANGTTNGNVKHARWMFTSLSNIVTVHMVAQHSASPHNTLYIRVGGGALNTLSSAAGPGSSISINCASNQPVRIYMKNSFSDSFPCWDTAADGYCHVKVLGFPGFDKTGSSVPSGLWLGWEDARNHASAFDYNNMCVVLTGCQAKFITRNPVFDAQWDTVVQNPRPINLANRIISRTIEDTL